MARIASSVGCLVAWMCTVGCGPSVASSSGTSDSTTSGDASSSGGSSLTATVTSSPSTSESSLTQGSADESSGEASTSLETGSSGSSSETGDFDQCAGCGPDEVCIHRLNDSCNVSALPCVPIPDECEVVTCDDPECAQALCGDGYDCIGYGGPTCDADEISDGFVCASRSGGVECDLWAQDCPEGEKCNAWSDDNDEYDHTICIPIARDAAGVGEPCTVEDYALSGIDDCVLGAQCLEVDPETLAGVCRSICSGSEANPSCSDPEMTCMIDDNHHGWCVP